jgi:hypothetical protein
MAPEFKRRPSKFRRRVRQLQPRRRLVIGRKVQNSNALSAVALQGPLASETTALLASTRDF